MLDALGTFLAQAPQALTEPTVAEAALAAAADATERGDLSEHVTYVRMPVPEHNIAVALRRVRALVADLRDSSRITRWWWLEKADDQHHHLRLRLHGPAPLDVADLARLGPSEDLRLLRYEPEMALFGGPEGLALAHRFHHVDSEILCDVLGASADGASAPIGLTVRTVVALLRGSELDTFECWDVWQTFADQRRLPPPWQPAAGNVAWLRRVLPMATDEATSSSGTFAPYLAVGADLARAHRAGRLERTPRQVIVGLVIFHCNRARHSYAAQASLAAAAAMVWDPMPARDRAGTGYTHSTAHHAPPSDNSSSAS